MSDSRNRQITFILFLKKKLIGSQNDQFIPVSFENQTKNSSDSWNEQSHDYYAFTIYYYSSNWAQSA